MKRAHSTMATLIDDDGLLCDEVPEKEIAKCVFGPVSSDPLALLPEELSCYSIQELLESESRQRSVTLRMHSSSLAIRGEAVGELVAVCLFLEFSHLSVLPSVPPLFHDIFVFASFF
jgi:hypothetical protein